MENARPRQLGLDEARSDKLDSAKKKEKEKERESKKRPVADGSRRSGNLWLAGSANYRLGA